MGMGSRYYYLSDDSFYYVTRKNGNEEMIIFGKRSKRNGRHLHYIPNKSDFLKVNLNKNTYILKEKK